MRPSFANQVVNKCLRITEKDNVTISVSHHVVPIAEDIAVECFRNGADVLLNLYTDKYHSAYLNLLPAESLKQPSVFCRALTENSTAEIFLLGAQDPEIFRKTPPEKMAADGEGETKAHFPLAREKKIRALSIGTSLLTRPRARRYGFNFARWAKMMTAASNVDYDGLAARGKKLKDALSSAGAVHVTAPNGTDLTFDVTGRTRRVSDGVIDDEDISAGNFDDSLPAGSISICPIEESAQGTIKFNAPTPFQGVPVKSVKWRFRDGRVIEFEGGPGAKRVLENWHESGGDKDKIANFTIGFNPLALTGYTVNDIAAGAVSVAIGGNEGAGGKNKSPFYFMGTLTGATVAADGKTVVKAGKLPSL
jgi:leucyl aminopeptidase (aminopeptidase T)